MRIGQVTVPLYARVIAGVVLGALVGLYLGTDRLVLALGGFEVGISADDLGRLGLLVIRILKMLAVPLVLFAILDAIIRTEVTGRMGARLIMICLFNVTVAFAIGLVLMNALEPGESFRGHLTELGDPDLAKPRDRPAGTSLSPLENLEKWIPETAVQPFAEGNVIPVVLLALLGGAAIRRARKKPELEAPIATVASFIEGSYGVLVQMLSWIVEIVPFAVFGVLASVVGKAGLGMFAALSGFVGVILLGFTLHAFGYYVLMAWFVGRKPPRVYLGKGANAIVTGLSTNSSLATMPITLRSLDAMGVSPESARMSACVGTNLNNDGITLYEAMAAIFLAQALGYDLSMHAQLTIVLSSLMAGIGIAGIPEAGLIVLPLVLSAAGLPEKTVIAVLPVVLSVDWILARCRSAVNVMSDMLVAILLDRWR